MKHLYFRSDRSSMVAVITAASVILMPEIAHAHAETHVAAGLLSGLLHPVLGIDHLVAMVAVGIWGAQLGQPAIWMLPVAFPAMMAGGAVAGMFGLPLPGVEVGVALSALLLGVLVLFKLRLPLAAAIIVVAGFALFHGHAHGTELPHAANPLAYGTGFVVATGLLHLAGIAIGMLVTWPIGEKIMQACGAIVAVTGSVFLAAALGIVA